ncbi:transcriptional regulator [Devosia pacifica]|uniref:Transcriptional regulator n=1 Tax=Devosia pacifica TaxID=1335967 RepID=A0A918VR57_9HYPH|nr:LysR substrate-binding domain-containing protein [Devosia pacifica]GHA21230.1 transcriptional regulator [Devosia pacifica]
MSSAFPIPLNALRAIEIVARRGALAPAAEELGVTVGAVSQHIRRAEARLGVDLFERTPRGLIALPVLAEVLPQLSQGFTTLADSLATLSGNEDQVLTVTVAGVFASRWLIWRIGEFSKRHPNIELRLSLSAQVLDLNRADIDCGIRFGEGHWSGVRAEPIGGFEYRPVCGPRTAERLASASNLADVPVIRDTSTMLSWQAWWTAMGVEEPLATSGPTYHDPSLAFDAAISEQGVLLTVDMMTEDAVRQGRLVRPFATAVTSSRGYWLVTGDARRATPKVSAFRAWLLEEARLQTS